MKGERIESATSANTGVKPVKGEGESTDGHGTARSGSTASMSLGGHDNLFFDHEMIIKGHWEHASRTQMKKQERKLAKLTLRKQLKATKLIPPLSKMVISKATLFEKLLPIEKVNFSNLKYRVFLTELESGADIC